MKAAKIAVVTNNDIERLRSEIQQRRERGTRARFEAELRDEIIQVVQRERATGRSLASVVKALGVSRATFDIWRRDEQLKTSGLMRPVELVREELTPRKYVLRGPGGTSVEGLSLDEVTELLRRLG